MKNNEKTNVMRLLDQKKIEYTTLSYIDSDAISAVDVATYLNEDLNAVFKTLVTIGASKRYYVFVVPATKELNLKKAAKSVNEKSIEMIKSKDLLPLTGYIHGGCSPIGMKKFFPTTIDSTALNLEHIYISGGKIGYQVMIKPSELAKIIKYNFAEITD